MLGGERRRHLLAHVGQEFVAEARVLHTGDEQRVVRVEVRAHAAGFEPAVDRVGVDVKRPVEVEQHPAPLAVVVGVSVSLDVERIAVAGEDLDGHVLDVVADVDHLIEASVEFVARRIHGVDPVEERLKRRVGALEGVVVGLDEVDVVLLPLPALELADRVGVDALAQVVLAPVDAVQIEHADLGLLIHHRRVRRQRGQHRVAHARAVGVLPGRAQQERLVLRVIAVGEQRRVEAVVAVARARDDLERLLRLGAAVLAVQLDAASLREHRLPIAAEHFDVRLALPVLPVVRALIGVGVRGVRPLDHDACLFAGEVVRVGDQRDDVHAVSIVDVVEVALRVDERLEIPVAVGARAQNGRAGDLDRAGVRRGGLGGIGAVERVVDPRSLGDVEFNGQHVAGRKHAAFDRVARLLRPAEERLAVVARERGVEGEVVAARAARRPPEGDVLVLLRDVHAVDNRAVGAAERHGIAAVGGELEVGVHLPFGGCVKSRAEHGRVGARLEHRSLREAPLARARGVVGQAVAA